MSTCPAFACSAVYIKAYKTINDSVIDNKPQATLELSDQAFSWAHQMKGLRKY